ncbi:MAG: nucleotidyltransferase domain-containing protein [Mollicutes bacterium UO1]
MDYLLTKIEKEATKYSYQFYAYVSRVKGTAKKYSDLDFCFYGEIPWNVLSHIQEDWEESSLPFKVELVAWNWMSS